MQCSSRAVLLIVRITWLCTTIVRVSIGVLSLVVCSVVTLCLVSVRPTECLFLQLCIWGLGWCLHMLIVTFWCVSRAVSSVFVKLVLKTAMAGTATACVFSC